MVSGVRYGYGSDMELNGYAGDPAHTIGALLGVYIALENPYILSLSCC